MRGRNLGTNFLLLLLGLCYELSFRIPQIEAGAAAFFGPFRPPSIRDELGCSPTLSVLLGREYAKDPFLFDPLNIATDDNFARLREGELKSGRIAMLAVLETVAVPLLHRMTAGYSYLPPKVWDRVTSASPSDAIKVVLTCWILETFVLVQRDPKDLPGDYGLGYFGVRDKGLHESSLIAELEHGRLAMMALVVQLSLERFFDMSWDEQWALLFKRWADQL